MGKDMQADAKILPTKGDKKHYPLSFNLLPQIDVFEDDGYSHEEWKMIHETKKIMLNDMDAKDIKVTATCVRVYLSQLLMENPFTLLLTDPTVTVDQLRAVLKDAPGVVLQDDPAHQVYPQPINAVGKRDTFVGGRLRADGRKSWFL